MPLSELRQLLAYDPLTGLFTWQRSPTRRMKAGTIAGSPDREGYTRISIKGRLYKASRLAFLFMLGEFPMQEVDHINGIAGDDRWDNLREVTRAQNATNRSRYKQNKSGLKGVCKCGSKWKAAIQKDGKVHYLGLHSTPEIAHQAYCAAARKLHGEFARAA